MPITASYSSGTRRLTVFGDAPANSIIFTRLADGTLRINGGAVTIAGGPATVANTDFIDVFGDAGGDIITLDESGGALPAANMLGGADNDILTGGSNGDSLSGESGADQLFGMGGNDTLSGGIENDTLTGGDGDDTMSGGDGNDRMIWNPGDDNDVMEGGNNIDTAEINGGNGAEVFTVTANVDRVRFDRIDPAPFMLDIGTTESLVLNAGGGDDSISTSGNLAALISLTLNGGAGNDTILGSNGIDTIFGEDGIDFVDGQQGNDIAFLGAGDDTFQWDPGDGSDTIEGQGGTDTLLFNGSAANEIFDLVANGARTMLTRNVGAITMDANDLEVFTIRALGGTDTVTVGDLTGTDATQVAIDLAGTIGGSAGDAAADVVTVNATAAADTIVVTGSGTGVAVSGLPTGVAVTNSEGANDSLVVNGLGGADSITATTMPAGITRLTLDGGAAADTILGSQGADTLFGGDGDDFISGDNGNDIAFLGANNDVFQWDPGDGNDVVEGQDGVDELRFNGSNANETINIQANGGRSNLLRDVAAVTMDMDDLETIRLHTLGGADTVVVANMTGTDVTQVVVDLAASGGAGDGQVDTVTVQATNSADTISVDPGIVVSGLAAATRIENSETTDRLVISANGGDDVVNASTIAAGQITLEILGGLGTDLLIGSAGGDLFNGGDGNDTVLMGGGDDVFTWNPGDDNDTLEGQAGNDQLAFNGANVAETITISANGGRALFLRDVALVTLDMNDLEHIVFNAVGGADVIVVNDLSGTDVNALTFNLAGTIGGTTSDAQVDAITLNGDSGSEIIELLGATGSISVFGMPALVGLNELDATDLLTVNGGGGNDTIRASSVAAGIVTLAINGGAGNDTIEGTAGADTINGGDNDDVVAGNQGLDTVFLGSGNDRFVWNPGDGNDVVEGEAGTDELFFNGSNANEIISIQANGARTSFQRDVAAINLDLDDIETITFNALGGSDNITVGNLVGTDVSRVIIDLAASGGAPDALADIVNVTTTAGSDTLSVTSTAAGVVTISGLGWTVEVRNFDASDRLVINGGLGNDMIIGAGSGMVLELNGGDGNDSLMGGRAHDFLFGGPGDDSFYRSPGGDFIDGGGGNDFAYI